MVEQLRIMKGNQLRKNRQIFCIENDKKSNQHKEQMNRSLYIT